MALKEKKGGKGKMIIFIMIGLLALGVLSFGGMYLVMKNKNSGEEKPVIQAYHDLGEMMVNLDSEEKSRYIKVKVSVGYDEKQKDGKTILEGRTVVLRDAAIYYLKGRKVDDFKAGNEKQLKESFKNALNDSIEEPLILDVYMNDIIIQ